MDVTEAIDSNRVESEPRVRSGDTVSRAAPANPQSATGLPFTVSDLSVASTFATTAAGSGA